MKLSRHGTSQLFGQPHEKKRKYSMTERNHGLLFLCFGLIVLAMLFGCDHTNPGTGSYGGTLRTLPDFAPADPCCILTTNNYYAYQGTAPYQAAVSKVHGYHSTVEEHDYRFQDMLGLIAQYKDQNRAVGTREVIELLRAASTSKEYSGPTEFSIIWYPNSMEFALAKEDLVRKILDAPFTIYNRFTFDEVFR